MLSNSLEEQAKEEKKKEEVIYLRNYSKVIFLFPLFITTIILWTIQYLFGASGAPVPWLGFVWTVVFFVNLLTMAFDMSSTKFFIIILIIAVLIVLSIFLSLPALINTFFENVAVVEFNIGMNIDFYFVITVVMGILLLIALIAPRFNYWKLERNELYHRKGIFVEADRYPTKGLRYKKKIPDVLEFFFLGAGSLTLLLGTDETEHLSTILRINNKLKNRYTHLFSFYIEKR
jgi:magnesium-transporting ATPase (P-type)